MNLEALARVDPKQMQEELQDVEWSVQVSLKLPLVQEIFKCHGWAKEEQSRSWGSLMMDCQNSWGRRWMEEESTRITRIDGELKEFCGILFLCVLEKFGEFGGKIGWILVKCDYDQS